MKKKVKDFARKAQLMVFQAAQNQELMQKTFAKARMLSMIAVLATGGIAYASSTSSDGDIGTKMFTLFGNLIRLVGVFLTGFGVVKLLMAMNNDNPDKQKEAAGSMAVGIIMIAMPTILSGLGIEEYVNTNNLTSSKK